MNRTYMNEVKKTEKEMINQYIIVNGGATLILNSQGWTHEQIKELFRDLDGISKECSSDDKSLLEICEEETGIEFNLDGMKSYHEYAFLDHNKWDGKPPSEAVAIHIMHKQLRWMPTIYLARLVLGLSRREWEFEKLSEFVGQIDDYRKQHNESKWYKAELSKIGLEFDTSKMRWTR